MAQARPTSLVELTVFVLLACAISWSIWAVYVLGQMGLGPKSSPYWHLWGSLGPALSAGLIAWVSADVRLQLRVAMAPRATPAAWAFAILGPLALLLLGFAAQTVVDGTAPQFDRVLASNEFPALTPLALIVAQIVFFGFGEEIGWRAYAMPRLADRCGLVEAAIVISLPWALWHLPLLFANPAYRSMGPALLLGWLLSIVAGSLLMAWVWRLGKGAVAPIAVFHGLLDIAMVNPAIGKTGMSVMGAAVTLLGVGALIALRRTTPTMPR